MTSPAADPGAHRGADPDAELVAGGSHGAGTGGDRVRRFADLAALVLARPARLGPVRLVTVDGLAGSGKSTFARRLAVALRATAATVGEVHTDDLLEGWTGITTFWSRLEDEVLTPLANGRPGAYHSYDWGAGRFRSLPTPVPVTDVLIVEGVTSAAVAGRGRRSLAVRVAAPRDLRLARGIARDGEALRQHWVRWMRDEDAYVAAAPHDPADVVVDGAPTLPHDADREYVESGG